MENDFLKQIDSLFNNNRELIEKLAEEKRLLESLFLDNRIPEELKKDLLSPYKELSEVIDKRADIYKSLKQAKEIPNLVGVLYNEAHQEYLNSMLKVLQDLSIRRSINILCFTLSKINLEEKLAEGLLITDSSITQRIVTIPDCTFNIGYYSKLESINKIKQMYMNPSSKIVNPFNIFNQAVVFDILSSVQTIKEYMLPVSTFSPSILPEYLSNSDTVFLLPERGIYNNPAVKIEKNPQNKKKNCSIESGGNHQYCSEKNLYQHVKKMITNKKYVAVQGKKMLLFNGNTLEARVYVQKGITGKWSVTAMIAKNEIFLKDPIYKDTADDLERTLLEIIPDKVEVIMKKIEYLSLNICSYMDFYFLNLGSCSADFTIDESGSPFIIGFGGFDQKDFLFNLNEEHLWDKYIANSIDYLLYLKHTDTGG